MAKRRGIMKAGVDLVGMEDIVRKFQKIASVPDTRRVEDALYRVARHVSGNAKRSIQSQVRPKTGRLFQSIQAGRFRRTIRGYPGAWVMADRKIAPHSHLIEFGHLIVFAGRVVGQAPAFPFMRPSLDGAHNHLRHSVRSAVPQAIKEAIR